MSNGDRSLSFHGSPTLSSERGLLIGRLQYRTRRSGEIAGPVYIEKHQGKHTVEKAAWGYRGGTGSQFLSSVADWGNLDLFRVIVCKLWWSKVHDVETGADVHFTFPDMKKVAGDSGTKGVHVQASFEKAGSFFQFHCYPDPNSEAAGSRIEVRRQDYDRIVQNIRLV